MASMQNSFNFPFNIEMFSNIFGIAYFHLQRLISKQVLKGFFTGFNTMHSGMAMYTQDICDAAL